MVEVYVSAIAALMVMSGICTGLFILGVLAETIAWLFDKRRSLA